MIFAPFIILAIFLYAKGYKVLAFVIFFFFITSGFDLIPEEMFDSGIGISKGSDFAFFTLFGFFFMDLTFVPKFLKLDTFAKYLITFLGFLFICILYSKFFVQLSWSEIIRTSRFFLFLLAYFVFRNMTKEELTSLLRILFLVTVVLSFIYLLQIIIEEEILNKAAVGVVKFGDIKIRRYYNQPMLLSFMAFMAIYKNPLKGIPKIATTTILVLALIGAFHRSIWGAFIIVTTLIYVIQLPKIQRIKVTTLFIAFMIPAISFVGYKFTQSRTYVDLQSVLSGSFVDIEFDMENLHKSSFAFRIGILFEKIEYLSNHPQAQILGAGLIAEDSKKVDSLFDFTIGLPEEITGKTQQIESGDISYAPLVIRIGYVGLILYMMIYFYLMYFFFKQKKDKTALFSFGFLIYAFFISFVGGNLLMPATFLLPMISYIIVNREIKVDDYLNTENKIRTIQTE